MPPQVVTPGRLAAAARCAQAQRPVAVPTSASVIGSSATITTATAVVGHASARGMRRRSTRAKSPLASGTFAPTTARRGTWRTSFRRSLNCCNVGLSDHGTEPSLQINAPASPKASKRPHQPYRLSSIHSRRPQSSLNSPPSTFVSPVLVAGFSTLSSSPSRAPSITLSSSAHATFNLYRVSSRPRCPGCFLAMGAQQKREHGGHSHGPGGHHHHHGNTYLVSANKNDPGVRITRIGLLSNLGMAIAKFVGGYTFNSRAMTADAWHSIADLASDILTLATVSFSLKPPTERFPMGFGKVESLGSLGVSGMLLFGGLYMGWESALSLYGHFYPEMAHEILHHVGHGHGHSHSHGYANLDIPSLHAAWLAGGTILVKEWLYRATMKVARERKSSVLASNAIHHRVDSLTGIVTLVAILGANTLSNAAWLDPVGGLLISIMVVNAGYGNTLEAFRELADQSIDSEVQSSIKKHALRALGDVSEGHEAELRDITGVKSGQNYLVDLEMAVPGSWTVEDTRGIENAVRTMVGAKVRGVRRVRMRFVSKDADVNERFDEFIPGDVNPEPESETEEHGQDHKHHNHKH